MESKTVSINWMDEESIKSGEIMANKLINAGYNHLKTIGGIITSISMYTKEQ